MAIIARLPSFTFEVPDPPFRLGSSDVEAKTYIGPLSADDYIFTRCALPHQDDYFNDKWFVTLSLVSGFEFGDAKMRTGKRGTFINSNSNQVCAGDLIIVDPRTTHWLVPTSGDVGPETKIWVGLQWIVPRSKLLPNVKKIVAELGARQVECDDRRYARMLAKVFP